MTTWPTTASTRSPIEVEPRLTTRFTRRTFAAREGSERVTCDRYVEMLRAEGSAAYLDPDHVLIESKSEGGTGDWDDALKAEGIEAMSLSKYRVGPLAAGRPGPRGAAGVLGARALQREDRLGEAVVVEVEVGAAPGRLEGR